MGNYCHMDEFYRMYVPWELFYPTAEAKAMDTTLLQSIFSLFAELLLGCLIDAAVT